jgi:hypothetical protein
MASEITASKSIPIALNTVDLKVEVTWAPTEVINGNQRYQDPTKPIAGARVTYSIGDKQESADLDLKDKAVSDAVAALRIAAVAAVKAGLGV